jgi:integrase/recombinase XerD
MKASKIELNGMKRIKIEFPYNRELASLLKQIPDAKWCQNLKAWHIPYEKKEFGQLKKLFPEIDYPNKHSDVEFNDPVNKPPNVAINTQKTQSKNVSVQVIGRTIIIKLPKNALDTHFIKSLRFSRWDIKQFCWIVPNYPGNLDLIKDYFNDRIFELIIHEDYGVKTSADSQRKIKTNQILLIKTNKGRIKLIFTYNHELTDAIKKLPFNYWDAKNKWWTIPYSEKLLHEIKEIGAQKRR